MTWNFDGLVSHQEIEGEKTRLKSGARKRIQLQLVIQLQDGTSEPTIGGGFCEFIVRLVTSPM